MKGFGHQARYTLGASGVMARHPGAAVERIRGRLERKRDRAALRATGRSIDELYPIDPNWSRTLHEALGFSTPCSCESEADALYEETMADFRARELPERYAGWCDGGRAFTKAAWALAVHMRPHTVVETGVARGVTSRFVLEALELSRDGQLGSVDLPSVDPRFHDQIGIAVPERIRGRWTLVSGTSRQRLPSLLASFGQIDLFIHDSLHTGSNLRFELEHAFAALRPGGAMLVDDVYTSLVFREFVTETAPRFSCIASNPDGGYRFGVLIRQGDRATAAP
jgi:hypothetical protein